MAQFSAPLAAALVVAGFTVPAATAPANAAPSVAAPAAATGTQTRAHRRANGKLLVTVAGLPTGVSAHVVVDGPGDYRASVRQTAKLRHLRRGRYTVVARPLEQADGALRGRVDDDVVYVRPDRTRRVTVTYRLVPEEADAKAVTPTAFEAEVVRLTNRARASRQNCGSHGIKPKAAPLTVNGKLTTAARRHAADMARHSYFAHESRDGRDPGDRMTQAGYRWSWWGENIAAGFTTPKAVVAAWLESDGHCVNLMSRNFTQIGVGYAKTAGSKYGTYWVQDFGRPR